MSFRSGETEGAGPSNYLPALDNEVLRTLIAMSPGFIGKKALLKCFAPEKNLAQKYQRLIEELAGEKFLDMECYDKGFLKAKEPWADIAIAEIPPFDENFREIELKVKNLPEDIPVKVVISRKQLIKHGLEPGDTIKCQLSRDENISRLRANFPQLIDPEKPVKLSGYFTRKAKSPGKYHIFKAGNSSIKTDFRIKIPKGVNVPEHRSTCYVDIPHDYDIRNPLVLLSPHQELDPDSGRHIDDISIEKHSLDRVWPEKIANPAIVSFNKEIRNKKRPRVTGISIDPAKNSVEIDDLIYAERLPNGGFLTRTSISDVAALIPPGSALDGFARGAGNTFYLKEKDILMLPPEISLDKGSLIPGRKRLAICVEVEYNGELLPVRSKVYPAIAKSSGALTYSEFAEIPDGFDECVDALKEFDRLLASKPSGGLKNNFTAICDYGGFNGSTLVETFMVRANAVIAGYLEEKKAIFPFRNNGPGINPEIYERAREELQKYSLDLPVNPATCNQETLARLLRNIEDRETYENVHKLLCNDLIDRAYYSQENKGHFNLRLPSYTHATSPLRRYADLLVQRSLYHEFAKANPEWRKFAQSEEERINMPKILAHLSGKNDLQRDIKTHIEKHHLLRDLKTSTGDIMRARILSINSTSLEIILPASGLHRRIQTDELPEEICRLDPLSHSLIFSDGASAAKGDLLRGKITNVDPSRSSWDYEIFSPS
jgi:hypothetical protein